MAGYDNHLSNLMGSLSVDDDQWIELGLDENIRTQLRKIKNDFESVFSWDIHQLTEISQNLKLNIMHKVSEKQEIILDDKENVFNFNRFFLQLITVYEHYMSKRYKESYLGIDIIVKFMETCTFDESNKQYSDAYYHIAWATNAYIALTLKIDSEKLLNAVKPINNFNQAEKAAICAVKAGIFMEYPPKGNFISLKFANQARTLHSSEPEWIIIWLKAKGRVRRHNEPYRIPEDDEIDAALYLYKTQKEPKLLIIAFEIFKEAGFVSKRNNNLEQSNKFYKLSSDIAKKSVELAKDDTNQLNSILMICVNYPRELMSKYFVDNLTKNLPSIKNSYVHLVVGKYYLNHQKDFEKAKMHFSYGKTAGDFSCSLQLLKLQCLLRPVDKFPYIQSLDEMYEIFQDPNRRITILLNILIYYFHDNYYTNNPKEMMRYLKLYIDQDIENTYKKRHLMFARSYFKETRFYKPNEFLNILTVKVKELTINNEWGVEKNVIDDTFDRFNEILKLKLNIGDNDFNDNNETTVHEKKESWRKQKGKLPENKSNEGQQHQSASTLKMFGNSSINNSFSSSVTRAKYNRLGSYKPIQDGSQN